MMIMIYVHQMRYRDFKTYLLHAVCTGLRSEFPKLVNYNRFVELLLSVLVPLCAWLLR
jgi:hypothetical protein